MARGYGIFLERTCFVPPECRSSRDGARSDGRAESRGHEMARCGNGAGRAGRSRRYEGRRYERGTVAQHAPQFTIDGVEAMGAAFAAVYTKKRERERRERGNME